MLKKLYKKEKITENRLEPEKGERNFLYSNKSDQRSPFLGFLDTSSTNVTEDMILDYLAKIIADIYLEQTSGNTTD